MVLAIGKRRLAVAALLLTIGLACLALWLAVATTSGAEWLVHQATGFLVRDRGIALKVVGIKGNLWDGVTLEECVGRLPGNRLSFHLASLTLKLLVLPSLQRGLTIDRCECAAIEVIGPPPATWVDGLPPIPFQCWMGGGGPPELRSLQVGRLEWLPSASSPLCLHLEGIALEPATGNASSQAFRLAGGVQVHGRSACRLAFSGHWNARDLTLSGLLVGSLLGHPVSTELQVSCKKGACAVSGQLNPAEIDLASFSRWLCPLWQNAVPVGLEGRWRGSGSWAWDPRVGVLANLSGEARGARLVALGLFWPIAELNVAWKVFDGRLSLSDLGSTLLGAPAQVAGEVALTSARASEWNLHLDVPAASAEAVLADIPWMVRTGFGLPALSGLASFSCQLSGTSPVLTAGLWAEDLRVDWSGGSARFHGAAEVRQPLSGPGHWLVEFGWSAAVAPAGLFDKMRSGHDSLAARLGGPVTLRARLEGPTPQELQARVQTNSRDGGFGLVGVWNGSGWEPLHLAEDGVRWEDAPGWERLGLPATAEGVSLRDLALLQGR